jgi:hypothetical protein
MSVNKMLPYLMSGFIAAVGLFFILAGYVGPGYLELQAPGRYYLLGLSIFFVLLGTLMAFLARRGSLKKVGITPEEVRRKTLSKLDDKQLLAKVALEEEDEKTRQAAARRLKEIED